MADVYDAYKLTQGSPLFIEKTVTVRSSSGNATQAWLTIKENTTQGDTDAIVKKSITPTAGVNGQITKVGGTDNTVSYVFNLVRNDTNKFNPRKRYIFDVWLKVTNYEAAVVHSGKIVVAPAVTLDPS